MTMPKNSLCDLLVNYSTCFCKVSYISAGIIPRKQKNMHQNYAGSIANRVQLMHSFWLNGSGSYVDSKPILVHRKSCFLFVEKTIQNRVTEFTLLSHYGPSLRKIKLHIQANVDDQNSKPLCQMA